MNQIPRQPRPDSVERYVRLTRSERRAYRQWRYVKEIQRYWRQRERELRPPLEVRLMPAMVAMFRGWLWLFRRLW